MTKVDICQVRCGVADHEIKDVYGLLEDLGWTGCSWRYAVVIIIALEKLINIYNEIFLELFTVGAVSHLIVIAGFGKSWRDGGDWVGRRLEFNFLVLVWLMVVLCASLDKGPLGIFGLQSHNSGRANISVTSPDLTTKKGSRRTYSM